MPLCTVTEAGVDLPVEAVKGKVNVSKYGENVFTLNTKYWEIKRREFGSI